MTSFNIDLRILTQVSSEGTPKELRRKSEALSCPCGGEDQRDDFIILPCTSLGTHSHKWLQEDHFVASICEHKSLLILGREALTM